MAVTVYLGNHHAVDAQRDGKSKGNKVRGKQRTEVLGDDARSVKELLDDITRPGGIWDYHSTADAPAWVSSDSDRLANLLSDLYGCERRDFLPQGEDGEHLSRPSVVKLMTGLMLWLPLVVMLGRFYLRTNAGTDWQSDLMGSAAGVPAKYMALSATSGENATHTSLAGEITTASGGLIRAAATYAHTTGAATYTLTKTFTANGSDSLPVTVKQCALFTASSSGVMAFEKIITDTLFAASGDAATVTYTVTP